MSPLFAVAATGLPTFALISALWGYGSSWLAEILKQDGFPTAVNTVIADVALLISATLATFTATTFTWNHFGSALLAAGLAALLNHQFVLQPSGIGDALQTATSVVAAKEPAASPASGFGTVIINGVPTAVSGGYVTGIPNVPTTFTSGQMSGTDMSYQDAEPAAAAPEAPSAPKVKPSTGGSVAKAARRKPATPPKPPAAARRRERP